MEKIYSNEIIKAFPIFQAVKDGKTIGKPKKGLCPYKWLDKEFFIIKFK